MFAIVDCNSFYCSCEQVFQPKLKGKPVVVLSNNDALIIARNAEAKALGIEMCDVWHEIKSKYKGKEVHCFTSNYTLYGNLSARIMSILSSFTPEMEPYSIDEAFLNLTGFSDLEGYARHIREIIKQWTGVTVSIGIAPTKTLAKVANKISKKDPALGGVYCLTTPESQEQALSSLPLSDVWGIARRLAQRLEEMGLKTPLDVRNADPRWLRKNFNVVVERVCLELKGIPCIELELVPPAKKSLICSRSYGKLITDVNQVRQSVCFHASRGGEKLREQGQVATQMVVFLQTNPFRANEPQYMPSQVVNLPIATSDSRRLVKAAVEGFEKIWRPGFRYHKAGIVLNNLHFPEASQLSLWDNLDDEKSMQLMQAMDKINKEYGRASVVLGEAGGSNPKWKLKAEKRSNRFTTRWDELPIVKAS